MNRDLIERKFEAMGARVRFQDLAAMNRSRFLRDLNENIVVDVLRDKKGEFFNIAISGSIDLIVPDVQPADRHLLLMARVPTVAETGTRTVKLLCGHDEREWFAAQVPGGGVSNVDTAKESIKPPLAAQSQKRHRVKARDRHRRKNKGFIRQGEWFFIPSPGLNPDPARITRREPIVLAGTRAGSKPHVAEEALREGGEVVFVHPRYARRGLTEAARERLFQRKPQAARAGNWQTMRRNPQLFVRGSVRHPDHKTIRLNGWHRVALNLEERGRSVAFLD